MSTNSCTSNNTSVVFVGYGGQTGFDPALQSVDSARQRLSKNCLSGHSDGDHGLPASVSPLQLADGVSGGGERIGSVHDRHHPGGLDELRQSNQVTGSRRRKQRTQFLADEPRQYKRSH